MKITITHHDGTIEDHEALESNEKIHDRLDGGITSVGFLFTSAETNKYVLIHPSSVRKIEWEKKECGEGNG